MKCKTKEAVTLRTKLFKRLFVLVMAALMAVSIFVVPELPQVEAASSSEYQRIEVNGDERVKVGDYYYWAVEKIVWKDYVNAKSASFKIMRSKSKSGKGKVIYKTSGTFKWKGENETLKAACYTYSDSGNGLGVFTNGTYVVFGECNAKTEKVVYWRIGVNGKGKKKMAEVSMPYYHPASASNFSQSGLMGVYKLER